MSVGLEQPGLVGEHDGLDAVAQVELLEDVGDVRLDGRLADEQLLPDLGVREAARRSGGRRRARGRSARRAPCGGVGRGMRVNCSDHALRDRG